MASPPQVATPYFNQQIGRFEIEIKCHE
jgi:hypothetical protein